MTALHHICFAVQRPDRTQIIATADISLDSPMTPQSKATSARQIAEQIHTSPEAVTVMSWQAY